MTTAQWTVRHGDTARSQVWAITTGAGDPMTLDGWEVHAQARPDRDSERVLCEWSLDHGATVGSAQVRLDNGALVTTATVQLHMSPGDYQWLPRSWAGVFDVEIAEPDPDDADGPPLQRFTVVDDGRLMILPDVTHDG